MQNAQAATRHQDHRHQQAIFDMLTEEHRRIQQLFQEFEYADDEDSRRDLVIRTCTELTVHAQLEEELFYAAIREDIDDPGLVDQAQIEHGVIKDLITQLEYTEPDDDLYDATFRVLGEYVNHHVDEEETGVFAYIREAGLNLSALRTEMLARRAELRNQHGLESDDDADEEDEDEDEIEENEDHAQHQR